MKITITHYRSVARLGIAVCALLLPTTSQAALLNLNLAITPDIVSGFMDVSYDAATDSFSATGFALELKVDGAGVEPIADGSFLLDATIAGTGALTTGTVTIGGTIAGLGFNSGTLLTGMLTAFSFPAGGGNPLEFTFDITGGDAAAGYGPNAGIIMADTGFTGGFNTDFDNLVSGLPGTGSGFADTAPMVTPVPAALWLFGSGLFALAGITRRRHVIRA